MINEPEVVLIRNGDGCLLDNGTFTDEIKRVERVVKHHHGWRSITYQNKRYQLFGGIRTEQFISLRLPIERNPKD